MIEVKYVCSNGTEYNLVGDKLRPTSGYFHDYTWEPNVTELDRGDKVLGFGKKSKKYSITFTFRGDDRLSLLDELTDAWEYDIAHETPGRIYFGNYYIECYIINQSDAVASSLRSRTDCEVSIYCPAGFWYMDETKSFYALSRDASSTYEFLDYTYGYNYDFAPPTIGLATWVIDNVADNHFEMTIFGPCSEPRIVIGSHVYQILEGANDGEWITINSRDKTVIKHLASGSNQNIFYSRSMEDSVFEQIPSGKTIITWDGSFGFDITLYKERSVPKWT